MKFSQLPHSVLMIRPASFGYNQETAGSNAFQRNDIQPADVVSAAAVAEFDKMVDLLQSHDIEVIVVQDNTDVVLPDAVFPNNWISFHEDGFVILYPMMAENRRLERRSDLIDKLKKDFRVSNVIDFSGHESENAFLEGTGSVIFDHSHKKIYACLSPRTHETLIQKLAGVLSYQSIVFRAFDENKTAIYHTNVMMSIGNGFVVICLDAIPDEDQDLVLESFATDDMKVIAISYQQMHAFAGNMLTVKNKNGEAVQLMSETAFKSLIPGQINEMSKYAEILPIPIDTIERYGGGSVRCMLAGVHLPRK
ncbi:MAG TPA: arginine deiminase-related protein [Chryseosolibacter sp.]|nr:arginine deiminase-related protein [Chryseosolibacter sp.]